MWTWKTCSIIWSSCYLQPGTVPRKRENSTHSHTFSPTLQLWIFSTASWQKVSPLLYSVAPLQSIKQSSMSSLPLGWILSMLAPPPPHHPDAPHLLSCMGNLWAGTLPVSSRNFLGLSIHGPTLVLLGELMASSRGHSLVRIKMVWGVKGWCWTAPVSHLSLYTPSKA